MNPEDPWAAIGRLLPDGEALAAAVAAELGEPVDAVRPTVRIGMLSRRTRPGSDEEVTAAIEAERARVRTTTVPLPPARLLSALTQEELLAEATRLEEAGKLDLATIVTIQRTSGAIAARDDQRLVLILGRYGVIRRLSWEACVAEMQAGRLEPVAVAEFARFIMLWNELTSLGGHRRLPGGGARHPRPGRGGATRRAPGAARGHRRRRRRHRPATPGRWSGTASTRIVRIAWSRSRRAPRRIPSRSGRGSATRSSTFSPGASATCWDRLPRARRASGQASACRLSCRCTGGSRSWPAPTGPGSRASRPCSTASSPGSPPSATKAAKRGKEPAAVAQPQAWVAIGSEAIDGVLSLAETYADLVDATRTAQRLGVRGWIPDPERLAVERLLLADRELAEAAVRRELGPLLADERMGPELIETLQAYFDAGENIAEAARRLHLATRTVAYRMERIESLLGYPLDGEAGRRLSTALLIKRLQDA